MGSDLGNSRWSNGRCINQDSGWWQLKYGMEHGRDLKQEAFELGLKGLLADVSDNIKVRN